MGRTRAPRPRHALAAAAILGMVSGSLATMGTAHAAVMVSGSTIDSTGNYVEGWVDVFTAAGAFVEDYHAEGGAFDIPLENGTYKLRFWPSTGEHASEYYRDKADLGTADVVTVSGAAQTLPAWTIDRRPSVGGVVRTTDGRAVRNATVQAYDAVSGTYVAGDNADRNGAFRLGTTASAVKLVVSGYDPATGDVLATEWFNDKPSQATADPVAPSAAGADVGVITLAPGGSISGRVTSEAGAPLYRVEACSVSRCDHTDANGVYTIKGVSTGEHDVVFTDPIGEYASRTWDNVFVNPGQAVGGVNAALPAKPAAAPNGVDVSGTVRDELGGLGIGYRVELYNTPADPRDAEVVGSTITNRAGQYHFAQLDRIGGETEFKIAVAGEYSREKGDFSRRTIWSGNKLGYESAVAISAAPRVLDLVQPVAGGVAGTVTSEAGGVPDAPWVLFRDADQANSSGADEILANGAYDERSLWAGTYTVQFGAHDHVSEWWKDSVAEEATTITVKPGQVVTGISAVLAKDVKATERPEIRGNAWVGKTVSVDRGSWTVEARSTFTYEWLVGSTVVGTGPTLKLRKAHLGDKVSARVTNDAGFTVGQAVTAVTKKVGYQPKLKLGFAGRTISVALKAKPLKAKKVKAAVVVYEVVGKKANGEKKLKKLGKGKVTRGQGVIRLAKALGRGKHKLVIRIKGKGKVGSGDLVKRVKIKR